MFSEMPFFAIIISFFKMKIMETIFFLICFKKWKSEDYGYNTIQYRNLFIYVHHLLFLKEYIIKLKILIQN